MTKALLTSTTIALALALPAGAAAQTAPGEASCPPGSWFCAQPSEAPSSRDDEGAEAPRHSQRPLEPLPDPDDDGAAQPAPPRAARRRPAPPPPVVYGGPEAPPYGPPPEGPPPGVEPPPEGPPPYGYRPYFRPISPPHEWGLNLHIEGASVGHGSGSGAGMGGAGLGLRFKPTRRFGIEANVDWLGGTDYQGDRRHEAALTFNALLYLNPLSRAQVYLLAGFGWSTAHVMCNASDSCGSYLDTHYDYFGGQLGVGVEIRLSRLIALNGDLRGFVRTRTDDKAQSQPEFTDSYGRTTNTSGGALVTGGMTLYF